MAWGSKTGLMKRMDAWLIDQANEAQRVKYQKKQLSPEDIESFNDAADKRQPMTSKTEILAYLHRKNSYRMWRLGYDYRWMQRMMKKKGLNPEDARWLL